MCVNGHFNHPDMFYCRLCGIAMIQLTKVLVGEPRPALGVIVVADGSTYTVDEEYIVGREPDPGERRAIVLHDERVSRQHALLSASGWDLVVTDLNSSNGTYVKNPGWHDWVKAVPGHPLVVDPRGQIGMGSQVLVYESSVRPSKV
jgi:pSer/pThr/pTyr-binding forkhead associated (FHA) protein